MHRGSRHCAWPEVGAPITDTSEPDLQGAATTDPSPPEMHYCSVAKGPSSSGVRDYSDTSDLFLIDFAIHSMVIMFETLSLPCSKPIILPNTV